MTDQNVNADASNGEESDTQIEVADTSGLDAAELQAKLAETEQKNKQLFERAKKAEGFVLKEGKWVKAEKPASKPEGEVAPNAKTGELDETQLDYLDLKGITESEDIDYIEKVIKREGITLRQALKDEMVIEKLAAHKQKRVAQEGIPSSTKRGGSSATDNVDYWFQKYEQTGSLPEGMPHGMAEKLVNMKAAETDTRKNPYE